MLAVPAVTWRSPSTLQSPESFTAPASLFLRAWIDGARVLAHFVVHAGAAEVPCGTPLGNTSSGFGLGSWRLASHRAAPVTPVALLVPVFGRGSAALVSHEGMPVCKPWACGLILLAMVPNVLAAKRAAALGRCA